MEQNDEERKQNRESQSFHNWTSALTQGLGYTPYLPTSHRNSQCILLSKLALRTQRADERITRCQTEKRNPGSDLPSFVLCHVPGEHKPESMTLPKLSWPPALPTVSTECRDGVSKSAVHRYSSLLQNRSKTLSTKRGCVMLDALYQLRSLAAYCGGHATSSTMLFTVST